MKTIDLGITYPRPVPLDGSEPDQSAARSAKHYPSLSLPDCDCEDVPNSGEATVRYRLRRIDRGGSGPDEKPRVEIEVMAITLPGGKVGAKPARGFTEKMLSRALKGTAADDGSPGSPSADDEEMAEGDGEGEDEATE